jgi:hypothetical protein
MAKEARADKRVVLGKQGWIRADQGFAVRSCTIEDMSGTGVRILVDSPRTVSDNFNLMTSRDSGMGRACRIKWRNGREIGAEFRGR